MIAYTRLGIAMVAFLLCAGTTGMAQAADPGSKPGAVSPSSESSAGTVKGQVLTIAPDALVLGTDGGGQVRLKLDKDTKMERALKVGDKVEAEVGAERQALTLKLSDSTSGAIEEPKGTEKK
jgi:hypothetical protein